MSGKGGRLTFRRTTSMTGISFDLATSEAPPPPPSDLQNPMAGSDFMEVEDLQGRVSEYDHLSTAMILSPRYYNRISSTFDTNAETAPFLRTCGLCNRRLAPGRDIYMYRWGDKAFCSQECREQQMKQDERKERRSMAIPNDGESHNHRSEVGAAAAETTGKSETVAAS